MVPHTSTQLQGELFGRKLPTEGIRCPNCKYVRSAIIDSRRDKNYIRRRRECKKCIHRFTTFESQKPHRDAARTIAKALLKVCPYTREQLQELDLTDSIWAAVVRTLCEDLKDQDIEISPIRAILPKRSQHHGEREI